MPIEINEPHITNTYYKGKLIVYTVTDSVEVHLLAFERIVLKDELITVYPNNDCEISVDYSKQVNYYLANIYHSMRIELLNSETVKCK